MNSRRIECLLKVVLLSALLGAGCSRHAGPEMGKVSGSISLDGRPLPYAVIEFQPQDGRPSVGMSDESGRYQLQYSLSAVGARTGQHTVYVAMADADQLPGVKLASPLPKIPKRYAQNSELTAEVKKGNNTIDLKLTSP